MKTEATSLRQQVCRSKTSKHCSATTRGDFLSHIFALFIYGTALAQTAALSSIGCILVRQGTWTRIFISSCWWKSVQEFTCICIQGSKMVTLWGRVPVPGPGVLQEQGRVYKQFSETSHVLLKMFLHVSLLNWLIELETGTDFSTIVSVFDFGLIWSCYWQLNGQWWYPTWVSQCVFFFPPCIQYITDIFIIIICLPAPFCMLKKQSYWERCYKSTVCQAYHLHLTRKWWYCYIWNVFTRANRPMISQ